MADEAPPAGWFRYWVSDTFFGLINMGLHYGLRLLPIDVCSGFGGLMGPLVKFKYLPSDARARKVWKRLRPDEADDASTDAAMTRLWRCVGRTMAEFSVLDRLWAAGRISVAGLENLDAARATGKPLMFLGMHLGNWETIPVAMLAQGLRGASIAIVPENRFDHRLANQARDRLGGDYITADKNAAFAAVKYLKKKRQGILMYVDELARDRVWAPAFGRELRAGGNIAYIQRLARLAGAVIIPLYSVRVNGKARFKVTVLPYLNLIDTGDREADLLANVAKIDMLIDPIIRAHLDQWYYALDFEFDD